MIPQGKWHWFGLRVMADWHVAYRVVTVEDDGDLCRCAVWNKGETGGVWYKRVFERSLPFPHAISAARRFIGDMCQLYDMIEEDEAPDTWQYSGKWWTIFFDVSEDATEKDVRRAYQQKLKEVHPDMHPNCSVEEREGFNRQCRIVVEAYSRFKEERGIP